jgi:two-component system response regulator AgrA
MLSIAILDDDIKALENYEHDIPIWLKRNNINGRIVIATTSYKEFLKELKDQSFNVCILDIGLNSKYDGLAIASYIRKQNIQTEIIFCSGLLEYLPRAFDVSAYNFIPKKFGGSLEKCLVKLNNEIERRNTAKNTVEIRYGSRLYYVPVESILYFTRVGTKTIITTTARVFEIYDSLESFLSRLKDTRFVQCHRSTVINREFLDYIDIKTKKLYLNNGFVCEIGPKYYSNFIKSKGNGKEYAL